MIIKGKLTEKEWGESDDILFIDDFDQPLAELFQEELAKKTVSVRYWITDREISKDQAIETMAKTLLGLCDAEYTAHYSEMTGYLWTDEEIQVGGHNLLNELRTYVGKWLILEADIHDPVECS